MKSEENELNMVFKALSDPHRRNILERLALNEDGLSVSELAEEYDMSLPAVMKHLKILQRAGLIQDEKSGRVRHCRLDEGPILTATAWMTQQTKYWQEQFNTLATFLKIDEKEKRKWPMGKKKKK